LRLILICAEGIVKGVVTIRAGKQELKGKEVLAAMAEGQKDATYAPVGAQVSWLMGRLFSGIRKPFTEDCGLP
jgi:hypothetical protein